MKVCASTSELILRQKSLHRCINGQRQIRNTSDLYSNRSTGTPIGLGPLDHKVLGEGKKPSVQPSSLARTTVQAIDTPAQSALQKGCSYCSVCAGKRPHKSSAARRGSNRGSPRGKEKTFHVGGTSYAGRVDPDATN